MSEKKAEAGLKMRALPGKVLMRFEPVEEKSAGGIFIPDTSKRKSEVGEVYHIGDPTDEKEAKIVANVRIGDKLPMTYGAGIAWYFGFDDKYSDLNNIRCFGIYELSTVVWE